MLEGVRHGLVGGVGRSGTVHHLGQHAVGEICPRRRTPEGLPCQLLRWTTDRQRRCHHRPRCHAKTQHIAQALAVSTQLGKLLPVCCCKILPTVSPVSPSSFSMDFV